MADAAELNVWPSFADVTSTIALVLFVLVLLAYIKNLVNGQRLAGYQQEISVSEKRLVALQARLQRTSGEIARGQLALQLSQMKLEEQETVVANSNRELSTLRAQLEGLALLRVGVLNKVKESIEAQLGGIPKNGPPPVTIGDNGNIVINEGLVFEYNSYEVKEQGQKLLETLAKALHNVLLDDSVRENIDTIVVQGHTDDRGSAAFNRDLSAKRAGAVLAYLFRAQAPLEKAFGEYFSASAFSEFRPINVEDTEAGRAANRRIEVSVVLKDANVRRVIDEYTASVDAQLAVDSQAATDPNSDSENGSNSGSDNGSNGEPRPGPDANAAPSFPNTQPQEAIP